MDEEEWGASRVDGLSLSSGTLLMSSDGAQCDVGVSGLMFSGTKSAFSLVLCDSLVSRR